MEEITDNLIGGFFSTGINAYLGSGIISFLTGFFLDGPEVNESDIGYVTYPLIALLEVILFSNNHLVQSTFGAGLFLVLASSQTYHYFLRRVNQQNAED